MIIIHNNLNYATMDMTISIIMTCIMKHIFGKINIVLQVRNLLVPHLHENGHFIVRNSFSKPDTITVSVM